MGIDLDKKRVRSGKKKTPSATNEYHSMLASLYRFLARKTDSEVAKKIHHGLLLSKVHRPPVSISRLAKASGNEETILVSLGTVTNDLRLLEVPKMKVAALKFSEEARARITKAGGECITLDQLALMRPTGENLLIVKGSLMRETIKHFGAPGRKGSHVKPYVRSKGNKFERARGRRPSRAFQV